MDSDLKSFGLIGNLLTHRLFTVSGNPVDLIALIVVFTAIVVSVGAGRWAKRLTARVVLTRNSAQNGLAYSLGVIAQYFITITGILVALENVGISLTALAAFGAIITVGIGFGLQNIAQNFISGIILLLERPVQQGDFIIIGETVGTVDEISMRATRVLSRDNVAIIVPNSKLISEVVINQSAPHSSYRVRIALGVAYGSDTELVDKTLMAIAVADERTLAAPPPRVFFRSFGESTLDFELVFWLADPGPEPVVASDMRYKINKEFERLHIEMPCPQRGLQLSRSLLDDLRRLNQAADASQPDQLVKL